MTPTFGSLIRTADGFTVQITNYSSAYTWAGTATASGTVVVSVTGLVTVTNVAPGTNSTATITTTKSNTVGGSAQVSARSLDVAKTPTFGAKTATATGFTVQITNYSSAYNWIGTATLGSVAINSTTGVVTVTGVAANTSSTATITTTRTGYTGGSANATKATMVSGPYSLDWSYKSGTVGTVTCEFGPDDLTASGTVAIDSTGLVTVSGEARSYPPAKHLPVVNIKNNTQYFCKIIASNGDTVILSPPNQGESSAYTNCTVKFFQIRDDAEKDVAPLSIYTITNSITDDSHPDETRCKFVVSRSYIGGDDLTLRVYV